MPITELTNTSTSVSPNQDIVLDNFSLSNQVPEPSATVSISLGLAGLVLARRFLVRRNNCRRALV